jgi:hypothetical protein
MARNTLLLVIGLAILAAAVVGVNITRKKPENQAKTQAPLKPVSPATFTSDSCGIRFEYPPSFLKAETPDTNAIFTDAFGNSISLVCQKDIPGIALPDDKIETVPLGNVPAKLYHDASAKDGTPVDKLIFTNPKTGLDVFIAGYGVGFSQVVSTLQVLP